MATNNNINIQDLFRSYIGNSKDNAPHDEGQRKFEKKHITDKKVLFDPKLGAKNDQFQADNVKIINREKVKHGPNSYRQTGNKMGYNTGDDEQKVYSEEAMHDSSCTCASCMTRRGKKMTKEDVINATVARFTSEDFTPPTLEEKFSRAVEGINEHFALALVGLYESLNTDNKEEMVALMSTKEGMNKLIDFAINNGGE